ncbi:hypothetical protein N0V93_003678 [Gnomoniopsis smithogilvyi]|uniref:Uncharacterized protein n=1 Tax=Gnomoniopsis smithogilvyi TaxID=1191159 RepID=A0A9W8Z185_9PEZI|nr:hypothetical protein N0V93_003678 [Gnomoniopsis smithogilvyi]
MPRPRRQVTPHLGLDGDSDSDIGSDIDYHPVASSDEEEEDFGLDDDETLMEDDRAVVVAAKEVQDVAGRIREAEWDDTQFSAEDMELLGEGRYKGNRLPPEYYRTGIIQMNEEHYTRKDYSKGMLDGITRVRRQWTEYCTDVLERDWKEALAEVNFRVVYRWMEWCINQTVDKNGNRKRDVGSKSSLITIWCTFRLVYKFEMGCKINHLIDSEKISNGIAQLAKDFQLITQKRVNRPMTLADLTMQLDAIVRTTEKSFKMGECRILAVLCLLLLAPAGSRIQSVLDMRFGDIEVVLARDPKNGPHKLLIRFTMSFTKRYLGPKAVKTFLIPEIIFDPTLLLSPHVMLLGILFRHNAFKAEGLNRHPEKLAEFDIAQGEYELPLPFHDDIKEKFVFRRPVQTARGWQMSANQPITKGMMLAWVRRIGELVGFEHSTITYSLRYMAGNNLDRNDRHVSFDLWAMHRNLDMQQDLVYQSASHGHSVSTRRPISLTPEQSAALNDHPLIQRLSQQLERLPRYDRTEGRRQINRVRARLRRETKEQVRKEFTIQQAVDDIERQIKGQSFADTARARGARAMNAAQKRLVEALTAPLITDLDGQLQRRTAAINAIIAYCPIEEPPSSKVLEARQPDPPPELSLAPEDRIARWRKSVSVSSPGTGQRLKRCFICVGKAISLPPDDHSKWPSSRLLRSDANAESI